MKIKLKILFTSLLMITFLSFSKGGDDVYPIDTQQVTKTDQSFIFTKTDTISKTKDQLYSDTKMFIAKEWKSSKDVIQNDDKENGVILIKGISQQFMSVTMAGYKFIYSYSVTFKIKDGKYKIIIDNVYCSDAYMTTSTYHADKIQPNQDLPKMYSYKPFKTKIPEMMESLKSELQSIIDSYSSYIDRPSSDDGW
jgi:hypothetical protein